MIQDISAKRYQLISFQFNGSVPNYQFSWGRMLSAEGDTDVYLQYHHVRFASISRKSELSPSDAASADLSLLLEKEALVVLRVLVEYPEMVLTAFKTSEPSAIVSYLFKMTHLASTAYEKLIIKGAEPEIASARYAVY